MKVKSISTFVVCLIVIVASLTFLVIQDSETINDINKVAEDDPLLELGKDASFNDAVNAFSFDLFEKLFEDPEKQGNIFYSPYSTYTALAMAYEGAKAQTADEMREVLHINQDNEEFHDYMQTLYEYLNSEGKEYDISTANALWSNIGLEVLEEYKNLIKIVYGAESSEVDFYNPDEAAKKINQWVINQTNNLIKELVTAEDVEFASLVLTNAIYFKGTWQVQFEKEDTTYRDFETSKGDRISVPTMCIVNTEEEFNYFENENIEILEMPYSGDDISMMIFLPKGDKDLTEIVRSLDHENYNELINSMSKTKLDIYLPRFKIETDVYSFKDYLIDLGMPIAFFPGADFTGIRPDEMWISDVLHKAFINVSEEGTEAAAATAVIFINTSKDDSKTIFDADHPFLFVINHKQTNTILFMGKVENPLE